MDALSESVSGARAAGVGVRLPAQRLDAQGHAHVDQRAVLALALPLMANSAVQIILNLTDMWFMGRISTRALAAVGAVQWLVIVVVLVLGATGARRRRCGPLCGRWRARRPCSCWSGPRVTSFSHPSASIPRSSSWPRPS